MAILQWQRKQIGNVVHFLKRYLVTIPNDPEQQKIEACSLIDDAECILNNIHYAMNIVEYSAVSQLLYQSATSLRRRGYKSDSTEIISIHKHALNVTGEEASVFQWGTFLHGGGHHNLAVVHYKSALRRCRGQQYHGSTTLLDGSEQLWRCIETPKNVRTSYI